jgi:glycosyltransferase involved in cell wall biosynthesis
MACGTPVITSNSSSMPEVVGDAGLLVDPLDVDAIAAALRKIALGELSNRLQGPALERAGGFTWSRTARATITCYRAALAGRPDRA